MEGAHPVKGEKEQKRKGRAYESEESNIHRREEKYGRKETARRGVWRPFRWAIIICSIIQIMGKICVVNKEEQY